MENFLLSVIVPIYNTEGYLERCIKSIINQTYKNIELILVDDGSTDSSGAICDDYAKKDSRIRVFHKKNEGLVLARKYGVQKVMGEIITFVDSDDWIEADMYEQMMKAYSFEQPDLVSTGFVFDRNEKVVYQEIDLFEEGTYDKSQIKEKIMPVMMWNDKYGRRGISSAVWNKFFKKDLLIEVIKDIDKNITMGEDGAIVYPYIMLADNITIINHSWYHYVDSENSMSKKWTFAEFKKIHYFQQYMDKKFSELGLFEDMKYQIRQNTKMYLRPLIQAVYDCQIDNIRYIFPYELFPKGSNIVLYGAGVVGRSYWNCIKSGEYAKVASWVDRNFGYFMDGQIQIENPAEIPQMKFDYIVIAIEKEEYAIEIKKYLLGLGVSKNQIIWKKPQFIG